MGLCIARREIGIVMEYLKWGDLKHFLSEERAGAIPPVDHETKVNIIFDIAKVSVCVCVCLCVCVCVWLCM